MKPQSHEEHIRHTFDAFCKKVLRNEAQDYLDEIARKRSREISLSELPVEVMEQLAVYDCYFAEDSAFHILGCTVYVDSPELAQAIAALPKDKQEVILLFYFLEMSDYEIARRLKKDLHRPSLYCKKGRYGCLSSLLPISTSFFEKKRYIKSLPQNR